MDTITDYLSDAAARFDRAIELGRPREAEFIARQVASLYPHSTEASDMVARVRQFSGEAAKSVPGNERRSSRIRFTSARSFLLSARSMWVGGAVLTIAAAVVLHSQRELQSSPALHGQAEPLRFAVGPKVTGVLPVIVFEKRGRGLGSDAPFRSLASRRIPTWLHEHPEYPDQARDLAAVLQIHGDFGTPTGRLGKVDSGRLRAYLSSHGLFSDSAR